MIDFPLPDGTGADATDHIRAQSPSTAIVFLTADDGDELLLTAIEPGASSYLLKSASGEEIIQAIRSAAAGEVLISACTINGARGQAPRQRSPAREAGRVAGEPDPREQQILALMTRGAGNRAVAQAPHISYATVRTHVRSILVKLGARSKLDAVAKATQWGFRG